MPGMRKAKLLHYILSIPIPTSQIIITHSSPTLLTEPQTIEGRKEQKEVCNEWTDGIDVQLSRGAPRSHDGATFRFGQHGEEQATIAEEKGSLSKKNKYSNENDQQNLEPVGHQIMAHGTSLKP